MQDVDELLCVRQGLWFYAGLTTCHVRILRHHTLFGTHEVTDPPEVANDRAVECYYIRFDHPHSGPVWRDGGVALSLREAMFLAQQRLGPVVSWSE